MRKTSKRGHTALRRGGNMRLKLARYQKNMSQEDVAKALGVHKNTVGAWEQGKRVPDIEQACALAKLYDRSVDDLFCE